MHFLSSEKVDNGLIFVPLNNMVIPMLSTLLRGNIEEIPYILYPFSYGEDIFIIRHG